MNTTLPPSKKNENSIWDDWFSLYCSYKAEYGREPDLKVVYRDRRLGVWCNNQRLAARKGVLSAERAQRLTGAGFVVHTRETAWARWIHLYCAYKKEYGRDPSTNCIYQGQNLGVWCSNQRQAFFRGRLSKEQLQQLITIGFVFDVYGANWNELLDLYRKYKSEYGCEPRDRTTYQGHRLGGWCKHQRDLYKAGELSQERAQMLNELNFPLESSHPDWDFMFDLYQNYKSEYNREPATNTVYHGKNLGSWCGAQRMKYQNGTLSEDRIQRLSEISFAFNLHDVAWDEWLRLYCEYEEKFGRKPGEYTIYCGRKLGQWCMVQRHNYRQNKLAEDRIIRLRNVGFVFQPKSGVGEGIKREP